MGSYLGARELRDVDSATVVLALCLTLLVWAGCAPTVMNLQEPPKLHPNPEPLDLIATIEDLRGVPADGNGFEHEKFIEGALAGALMEANLFATVVYPAGPWTKSDITLRGRVSQQWPSVAGKMFVVHFPGGLIFAPNWHGLQYPFNASATVDLVDNRTGDVVKTYTSSASHMYIHKSGNPAHFAGAAIVVPAVIRGLVVGHAKGIRRAITYGIAYRDLWASIAQQIVEDDLRIKPHRQVPHRSPAGAAAGMSCDGRSGAPPRVGENWEEYRSCQESRFLLSGQVRLSQGVASVFREDAPGGIEVHVVDDRVLRWTRP